MFNIEVYKKIINSKQELYRYYLSNYLKYYTVRYDMVNYMNIFIIENKNNSMIKIDFDLINIDVYEEYSMYKFEKQYINNQIKQVHIIHIVQPVIVM
jgi:hypothetical protein